MCKLHFRNQLEPWCLCAEIKRDADLLNEPERECRTWAEVRFRIEDRCGYAASEQQRGGKYQRRKKQPSSLIYAQLLTAADEPADLADPVALADSYIIEPTDTVLLHRVPMPAGQARQPRWIPPFGQLMQWHDGHTDRLYKYEQLKMQMHGLRQRNAPEPERLEVVKAEGLLAAQLWGYYRPEALHRQPEWHTAVDYVNEHLSAWRTSPTAVEPTVFRKCTDCDGVLKPAHPVRRCPLASHPGRPRRWPGFGALPEPKGITFNHRVEVPPPSTAEEIFAVWWIDQSRRCWKPR